MLASVRLYNNVEFRFIVNEPLHLDLGTSQEVSRSYVTIDDR